MRYVLALSVMLAAVSFTAPAQAQTMSQGQNSRWCADYGGSSTNCGFMSIDQCRATISGFNRGNCYRNPQFHGNRR